MPETEYQQAFRVVREALSGKCRSDIGEVTLATQIVDALVVAEFVAPSEGWIGSLGAVPPPEYNDGTADA